MGSIEEKPLEALIDQYEQSASAHGLATESGDHRSANKAYRELAVVHTELRRRGSEAQKAVLTLLDNADHGVRAWAAAHALEFAPTEAERVLIALSEVPNSLVGFSAKMTLKQWREGKLRFP